MIESVRKLVKIAVYENSASIDPLFPSNFHKDLKNLILQIINARLPQWKEDALRNQCSLPKLIDFDWRIDIKRASDTILEMKPTPTLLVQLKVDNVGSTIDKEKETESIDIELSKQTLEIMLDGLSKIKNQLASLK